MVFSYNAFFGTSPEGPCLFCPDRRAELKNIVYEDETLLAVENRQLAGTAHWLIVPRRHIRDIESVTSADRDLFIAMETVKDKLLHEYFPDVPPEEIHVGYHRGHRPLGGVMGTFGAPDIISVHHLHLHVIVQPHWLLRALKYPLWFPGMWVSNQWLLEKLSGEGDVKGDGEDEVVEDGVADEASMSTLVEDAAASDLTNTTSVGKPEV